MVYNKYINYKKFMRATKIINKLEFKKEVVDRNWFHIGSTDKINFSRSIGIFKFNMNYYGIRW